MWSAEVLLLDVLGGDKAFGRNVPMDEDTKVVSFVRGFDRGRHGERFEVWLARGLG